MATFIRIALGILSGFGLDEILNKLGVTNKIPQYESPFQGFSLMKLGIMIALAFVATKVIKFIVRTFKIRGVSRYI